MGGLQVEALTGGVGGHQHLAGGIVGKPLPNLAAILAADAAVDDHHRVVAAQHVADLGGQIVEGVAVLGEDDELAGPAVVVAAQQVAVDDQGTQLGPLAVLPEVAHPGGARHQVVEYCDLSRQLLGGARRSGGVDDVFLQFLGLGAVELVVVVVIDHRVLCRHVERRAAQQGLADGVQAGAPALQRTQDRVGARRQPALQHGQRETHRAPPRESSSASARFISVRT